MTNPIFTKDKTLEGYVCTSLKEKKGLGQWWDVVCAMKLFEDGNGVVGINNWDGFTYWEGKGTSEPEKFWDELKKELKRIGKGDFVKATKRSRMDYQWNSGGRQTPGYKLEFTNYNITFRFACYYKDLFIPAFYYYTYSDGDFYFLLEKSVEEIAQWLVEQNQKIVAFRQEWDEYCRELTKRMLKEKIDVSVINTLLIQSLGEGTKYALKTDCNENGPYVDLSCSLPEVHLQIPADYPDWQKVADLFADIIKQKQG